VASLAGKVAIVTGGTSGIGEKIAELFVEEGAKVVVAARRQEEGRALEKRLGVRFIRTDVANEADVKAMVGRTVEWFGRIDCLVNNAGVPAPMISITEIDVASIDQLLAINVRGVMLGIKHVAPVMLAQGSGSIINIGSVAGFRGGASGHIYSASKAAVLRASTSRAACSRRSGFRPARTTSAPSLRARRAVSRPIPALPPITTTLCPASSGSRTVTACLPSGRPSA
jgi:NADP-dependent 3-hydroxy acid dehydrogenase YdfG